MNMNKEQLKRLIKKVLIEVATCHDPKTGFFAKCEKDAIYSLTKKGAARSGVDPKFVKRGTVTTTKTKDGIPRTRAKYGINASEKDSAGRLTIDGDKIKNPKYYVSKYKKKYSDKNEEIENEEDEVLLVAPGEMKKMVMEELKFILSQLAPIEESGKRRCPQGCHTYQDILLALNNLVLASKGEVLKKAKT